MTKLYAHVESEFDKNTTLETILAKEDDSENGYFVEVDKRNPDYVKKNKNFSSVYLESEKVEKSSFAGYMKNDMPCSYTLLKSPICNFFGKKANLCPYRFLNFCVRSDMEDSKLKKL